MTQYNVTWKGNWIGLISGYNLIHAWCRAAWHAGPIRFALHIRVGRVEV